MFLMETLGCFLCPMQNSQQMYMSAFHKNPKCCVLENNIPFVLRKRFYLNWLCTWFVGLKRTYWATKFPKSKDWDFPQPKTKLEPYRKCWMSPKIVRISLLQNNFSYLFLRIAYYLYNDQSYSLFLHVENTRKNVFSWFWKMWMYLILDF